MRRSLLCMLCCLVAACTATGGEKPSLPDQHAPKPPAARKETKDPASSISSVLADPAGYKDRDVVLEGTFRGWKAKCSTSSPFTRSDWVLEDGSACLYVTGRMPDAVAPEFPKQERVSVKGVVVLDDQGRPVLRASHILVLPR